MQGLQREVTNRPRGASPVELLLTRAQEVSKFAGDVAAGVRNRVADLVGAMPPTPPNISQAQPQPSAVIENIRNCLGDIESYLIEVRDQVQRI